MTHSIATWKNRSHMLMLAFVGFLVPIWIKGTMTYQSEIESAVYPIFTAPVNIDFFGKSKLDLLSVLIIFLAIQFVWLYLLKHKIKLYMSLPIIFGLGLFLVLFMATLLSDYPSVAMLGFSDRYEGFYAYAYYILLMLAVSQFVQCDEDLQFLLKSILAGSVAVVLVGVLQAFDIFIIQLESWEKFWYFGTDSFFQYTIDEYQEFFRNKVEPGYDIVGGTLQNPNYFSVYLAVVFQISLGFLLKADAVKERWVYSLLSGIVFLGLILGGSKTSFFICVLIWILQLVWTTFEKRFRQVLTVIPLVVGVIILFITIDQFTEHEVSRGIFGDMKEELTVTGNTGVSSNAKSQNGGKSSEISLSGSMNQLSSQGLQSIVIKPYETMVSDGVIDIHLVLINDKIILKDSIEVDNNINWAFEENKGYVSLIYKGKALHFGQVGDEVWVYGPRGLTNEIEEPRDLIFNGHMFTYRGYTWSLVIELIKERPILGYGPDLLTIYTPLDIINRFNYTSGATSIAINPHNMYLQYLFNGGLLAFAMFIGVLITIYFKALKLYLEEPIHREMLKLIMFPLTTFMAVGLLNDTIVGTGTILYLLIGGAIYTVNRKSIRRQNG